MRTRRIVVVAVLVIFLCIAVFMLMKSNLRSSKSSQIISPRIETKGVTLAKKSVEDNREPQYVFASGFLSLRPNRIENVSEYALMGRVLNEDGSPLPGAVVSVHTEGPDPVWLVEEWSPAITSSSCDSEGRYSIQLSAPLKDAVIRIRKDGHATKIDNLSIVQGRITKDYILQRALACVEGTVLSNGRPISGAVVHLDFAYVASGTSDRSRVAMTTTKANAAGKYVFRDLPLGTANIHAFAPGFRRPTWPAAYPEIRELKEGPCAQIDTQLIAGIQIVFYVKNRKGEPVSGAHVTGTAENWGRSFADEIGKLWMIDRPQGHSDERGRVEITAPQGTEGFDCRISADAYKVNYIWIETQKPPKEVILDAIDQSIGGRVLSEAGEPVPGAEISVVQTGDSVKGNAAQTATVATAKSDAIGAFALPKALPNTSEVRATKEGFKEKRMALKQGEMSDFLEIRLESCNSGVFGIVTDESGNPAKQFDMYFKDAVNRTTKVYPRHVSDDSGQFSIADIPTGTYDIQIQSLGTGVLNVGNLKNIVVKDGYFYGAVLVQLKALPIGK
jgi:uncharacterized GH25 family protein